jgi:hypothetical protein
MAKELLMDCSNVANFMKPKLRPSKVEQKEGYCKVCEKRLKKSHKSKTVQKLRKMKDKHKCGNKLVEQTNMGCPMCKKGKG